MPVATKIETFTADGQSTLTTIQGATVANTNVGIAAIEFKNGSSSGAVLLTLQCPATSGFIQFTPMASISCPGGNKWYVETTNLTGTVSIWGN